MFGYITASFVSFFVEKDSNQQKPAALTSKVVAALKAQIQALRSEL